LNGWDVKKLGQLSAIKYGYTEKARHEAVGPRFLRITDIQNGGVDWTTVPYCPISDLDKKHFKLKSGDIVFARTGATTGKSFLIIDPPDAVFASYLIRLRISEDKLLPEFLTYFFQTKNYWDAISGGIAGSAQGGFNASKLAELEVPFPSRMEQRRIVAILDEAFAGLEAMRANAEKNLQNARDLFDSYLKAILNQKSHGWIDTCIGDQVMLQRGFDITKDQQKSGKVPVVSSGGIKSYHDTAMVKGPGVVVGRKGTLGKTFYIEEDFWPHDTTLWIKDFKGNDPLFVYYFFTALDVIHLDSGAANPALNRNQVHPIKVVWPPLEIQKRIASNFDALRFEAQRLECVYEQKLAAIAELKQSFLQKAFSGQLTSSEMIPA
jgi:type I restriction enzyme S subunit